MYKHLAPTLCERLNHYEDKLSERNRPNIRSYAKHFLTKKELDGFEGCDSKTIINAMQGHRIQTYIHSIISDFVIWLEKTEPWLLQAYSLHHPSHLQIDFEAVLRSSDRDYRSDVAGIFYKQSFFVASAKILAGTAVLYAAKRDLQQQAKVLRMQASCAVFVNDHCSADKLLSEAAEVSREAGDLIGQLDAEEGLAFNNFQRGDLKVAGEVYGAIWKRAKKHDTACFGSCCYGLGRVIQESNPSKAIEWHLRGLDAFGSNEIGLGNCHYGLGLTYLQLEDWDEAKRELEEAERLFRNLNNNQGVAECQKSLAVLPLNKRQ